MCDNSVLPFPAQQSWARVTSGFAWLMIIFRWILEKWLFQYICCSQQLSEMPCTKLLFIMLSQPVGTGHKFLREQLINIWNSRFPKIPKVIMATKTRSDTSQLCGAGNGRTELSRICSTVRRLHTIIKGGPFTLVRLSFCLPYFLLCLKFLLGKNIVIRICVTYHYSTCPSLADCIVKGLSLCFKCGSLCLQCF